ncbi:MAG: helix-turn-helix domain-containing protein [Thermoleophilia bacterium]
MAKIRAVLDTNVLVPIPLNNIVNNHTKYIVITNIMCEYRYMEVVGMVLTSHELGGRISAARRDAQITQAELAERIDIDRSAVAKIEKGERKVDSLELLAISEAVGCSVESFLRQEQALAVHFRNYESAGKRIRMELDWAQQFIANYAFLKELSPDE